MHVGDLLRIEDLDLSLVSGGENLLDRAISGVTATDLEDPTRFVQSGDIVLSGLVWWHEAGHRARTDRFVSALTAAGAVALLAGEETHGRVPGEVADACREHGLALLSVPAHTDFRAITEAVYRHRWGDLSRRPADHFALPETVRHDLGRLLDRGAGPAELIECALAPFGAPPGYVLTGSGRTVARTSPAAELPAARAAAALRTPTAGTLRVQVEATPYDTWYLHVPRPDGVPPRALHETAEVIAQFRQHHARADAGRRRCAQELITLVDRGGADPGSLADALESCGLTADGPWQVMVTTGAGQPTADAARAALTEALSHLPSRAFAVGAGRPGEAIAVVRLTADEATVPLDQPWSLISAVVPGAPLSAGAGAPALEPGQLHAALAQARYARAAADRQAPAAGRVASVEELTSLDSLLSGVPDEVRRIFSATVLGPLAHQDTASHRMLLETLEAFLAHNCSWARTAEALHLHVNTVHYRIDRVQAVTGRDLTRLDHKLDLRAALLCR
ncbi:helix-turn-helix domain-containing protein [Streptomyces longispororuber]|uniref:helix-turn-helix domain-containing protein n=1 Tax=Streptomyces longispororuber TaxID=68230 RepID=UPI002109DBDC|nr:PucR family transcriptional regulator [Streptomyces longispororuber]MCQ4208256.1 PucR family transcriptional regulator [Streptomyces longispororuber]